MNQNSAEAFLGRIHQNPMLYDSQHEDYKDTRQRERVWAELGKEFNMSKDLAKKRYKAMRDVYMRNMRQKKKAPNTWRPYKYAKEMERIVIKESNNQGTADVEDDNQNEEESETEEVINPKQHEFSLKLLQAIKCRPALYNKESISPNVREEIWKEIADNLGISGEDFCLKN